MGKILLEALIRKIERAFETFFNWKRSDYFDENDYFIPEFLFIKLLKKQKIPKKPNINFKSFQSTINMTIHRGEEIQKIKHFMESFSKACLNSI